MQGRKKEYDLEGKTIGELFVKGEGPRVKNRPTWLCLCSCGKECTATTRDLISGVKKSCGHLRGHSRELDLTGKIYNNLTVLYKIPNKHVKQNKYGKTYWKCLCSCGKECDCQTSDLTSGRKKDCGHSHDKYMHTVRTKNIVGNIYGHLQVKEMLPSIKVGNKWRAMCRCLCLLCGNTIDVKKDNLIMGDTKSCGCLKSSGEQKVLQYLINHKYNYKRQYYFYDLITPKNGYCYFDFGIFDNKDNLLCLIEYQGIQHYDEYSGPKEFGFYNKEITDPLKREYCKNHNISLYEIKYDDDVVEKLDILFASLSCAKSDL